MPRSDFDDDDDRPRSRRRRDVDPPRKSGVSVWLILNIVFASLLLVCGVGGAVVVFGVVLPAAERVKAEQAEVRAEQEKARMAFEAAVRQPQNNRWTPSDVAKVKAGFTQAQVEELLGTGSPASAPLVNSVCDMQSNATDASVRWQAAHRVGKVFVWQNRDDFVLVAYESSPTRERTVIGLISLIGGVGQEPVRLPPENREQPARH
jgi:hypothetical protein